VFWIGLDDWIYCTLYTHTLRDYRQYSAIAILHTFQFTVSQALGLSVFISRILAIDLSQSHCNFNSHMKPSWHSLIPFLPFLFNYLRLPSPELDQILSLAAWDPRFIESKWTNRKHREGVSTAPLHSSRSYSIAAGMCLPSRCLAMDMHATVCMYVMYVETI
jgi:hypothetical protein